MAMKAIALGVAVIGFGFGIASAYYWWKSSREPFVIPFPTIITSTGPAITTQPLEDYLRRVGSLNAKAAMCGAIGVSLSTVAGIMGSL